MAAALNLHRLFSEDEGYLHALKVPEPDARVLRAAREEIRAAVRTAFANWQTIINRVDLFEDARQRSSLTDRLPAPRFRMQGSWAYHTENDCQTNPPQEIDLDDGVYLPLSFINGGGSGHPQIMSGAYFAIVEFALKALCERKRWRLNPDGPKPNCVRVKIGDRLHADLALYAIRDDSFQKLEKAAARRLGLAEDAHATVLAEDVYLHLAESDIFLANRDEGWIVSDPRRLENWFNAAVGAFGYVVRRLSRSFKGMRDATKGYSDLSSICIMAAIVDALQTINPKSADWDGRDDIALARAARHIAQRLGRPIDNPVLPGNTDARLCNGWSPAFRREVCGLFQRAADELDRAIYQETEASEALRAVRGVFGTRIPNNSSLIKTLGASIIVRSSAPDPQPRPAVPRTRSG